MVGLIRGARVGTRRRYMDDGSGETSISNLSDGSAIAHGSRTV